MVDQLLQTKLHIPPAHPNVVSRRRLLEKLNRGLHRKLTLVAAPAGFGKTTLVREWVHTSDRPAAWLSLDAADADPIRFLRYVIAALQTIVPEIGIDVESVLGTPDTEARRKDMEPLLTALINDIAEAESPMLLVLDDYHVLNSPAIDEFVTFLLEHQPATLHLVIVSRAKPDLPLSRLRARGQLTELGASLRKLSAAERREHGDLRFTSEEAAHFLTESMGLTLSSDEIVTLEQRTEGWIAGLQLAALSMQGVDDIAGFVAAFSGTNRYILDYLADEVLAQQPADTKAFLLETSILERFSVPLCDAVTERTDSRGTLVALETANLFLVALDDSREWYRYHHLFADLLCTRLEQTTPELVPVLHRRAGAWFEANGYPSEAMHHAQAAGDYETVTRLLTQHAHRLLWYGEAETVRRRLAELPSDLVRTRPQLALVSAWVHLIDGDIDATEDALRDAEEAAAGIEAPLQDVAAEIDALRAIVAVEVGEMEAGVARATTALEALPANDTFLRSVLVYTLGSAYAATGTYSAAKTAFRTARSLADTADTAAIALLASYDLGTVYIEQGRLREAEVVHRRAKQRIEARFGRGARLFPLAGIADIGLSRLLYEWNRRDEAKTYLDNGLAITEQHGDLGMSRRGYLIRCSLHVAGGDTADAARWLARAQEHAHASPRPDALTETYPSQIRVWLAQENVTAALRWASQFEEIRHLPLEIGILVARVWIAQGRRSSDSGHLQRAAEVLPALLERAETQERTGRVIEILALQALASDALDDQAGALTALERALTLAEPEGYVRTFIDAGAPVATLLRRARRHGIAPHYVDGLLAAFDAERDAQVQSAASAGSLIEPLTDREREVLALLAEGSTNREIARRLYIAVGTAKRHLANIYGKLDVGNRTEAVARARDLNLFD